MVIFAWALLLLVDPLVFVDGCPPEELHAPKSSDSTEARTVSAIFLM